MLRLCSFRSLCFSIFWVQQFEQLLVFLHFPIFKGKWSPWPNTRCLAYVCTMKILSHKQRCPAYVCTTDIHTRCPTYACTMMTHTRNFTSKKDSHATYASVIYGHIAFLLLYVQRICVQHYVVQKLHEKCCYAYETKRPNFVQIFWSKRPRIRLNCTLMSSSLPISLPTIFAVLCNTEDYTTLPTPISKPRIKLGKLLYAAKQAEETTARENVPRARSLLWELSRTIPIAGKHCSRQSCMRGITFC
jgi:hypothetical protein